MTTLAEGWQQHKQQFQADWAKLPPPDRRRARSKEYQRWMRTHDGGLTLLRERKRKSAARRRRVKGPKKPPYEGYWPIDELIIEIELLRGTDSPTNIARRLGYTRTGSLERRLRNHGFLELARMFDHRQAA